MHQELFGSSTALHSCSLRSLRAPVSFRQRRSTPKTLAARRGAKQEEEEKPQSPGLFGGLTSRIGAGSKQKAESGTEKVGRKQRASAAPKPERKQKAEPASGTQKIKGSQPKGNLLGFLGGRKDANTVFVAGGNGRLGARIVRELLNRGFKVRVGVRDQAQGDNLLKTAINYGLITAEAGRKAQIVEFDLLDEATIGPAIGNSSKVVSAIGAAESRPLDVGAPKRIDGDAATRLVNVAAQSGVEQFTMVTAMGTGKFGWPAGVLNLFWGVLIWKKKAEEALQASGMQYTIVRPGGMEKPRDDHKLTHNVILGQRDSTFGGTVSRLQVAELIGTALSEPSLGANKVLEVWSEKTAPAADYESLLRAQPNERASDEENTTAAQAVSAVEPGKGLKRQRTQKYAAPRTPGQTEAPTLPKAQPAPSAPKPQAAAAAAAATPAAPPKPKNPAEIRREEERQQELERQRQWQADQEAQQAANQIPSQQPKPRDLEAEAQEQKARAARNEEYARNRMATEARVQAEAEQERRSAREKESARREAEKQKRLQAADKESNARKQAEQQLLAQNKVTKVITPPGTNKMSSAEQELGSAQPSKKLPGAEQGKGEKKASAPKPTPAAASKPPSSAGASPEQAKKNAEEAAQWISNWRNNNGAASNGASSNGSSNGASASNTTSAASSNGSSPSSKGSPQAVKGKQRS